MNVPLSMSSSDRSVIFTICNAQYIQNPPATPANPQPNTWRTSASPSPASGSAPPPEQIHVPRPSRSSKRNLSRPPQPGHGPCWRLKWRSAIPSRVRRAGHWWRAAAMTVADSRRRPSRAPSCGWFVVRAWASQWFRLCRVLAMQISSSQLVSSNASDESMDTR